MKIRLSVHVEQKIIERELEREKVIEVALSPQQVVRRSGVPAIAQSKYQRGNQTYLMRVAFRDMNGERLVITAYETSKVGKYWSNET